MGRIDDIFSQLRTDGRTAIMPFIVAGYPELEATVVALRGFEAAGASIVEIGIPFSDPIADGPVIAAAMHETLEQGLKVDDVLAAVRTVRPQTDIGLVAMVSSSIVERRGNDQFLRALAEAGFDGVIIPDLDTSQAEQLLPIVDELGLSFTLLVAPTTTEDRLQSLLPHCRGFIYLLARTGLTGEQDQAPDIEAAVNRIRAHSDLPIAVGFGIAEPDHVATVTASADAAIVGSAVVRRMADAENPARAAVDFVSLLAEGLTSKA